jgi:Flp pilus assembly protein TadD
MVHFELGNLSLIQSQWQIAADHYVEAVGLQNSLGLAHYNLAICRQQLGDQDGAISAFEQACHQMPQDVQARLILSELLRRVGRQEDGMKHLQLAAALAPNDPQVKNLIQQTRRKP